MVIQFCVNWPFLKENSVVPQAAFAKSQRSGTSVPLTDPTSTRVPSKKKFIVRSGTIKVWVTPCIGLGRHREIPSAHGFRFGRFSLRPRVA
jgi:hypothetical protein